MNIRAIEIDDLQELLDLYADLHVDETPVSVGEAEPVWRDIQVNPDIMYFGAYVDDVLVSSCHIVIVPNLTRSCRPYGLIENVVTRKGFRRQGYGKGILEHALRQAWSRNCYKVMLMTGRLDEETFAFYQAAGFSKQGKQAFVARPAN
jgi:GNAT superfamily N-acetyltransferase